jgi:pimeloyl-ACP methyl ester carboxylesterase
MYDFLKKQFIIKSLIMKKTILSMLLTGLVIFSMTGCSRNNDGPSADSKTFVLVHGAWQAAYVWEAVKEQLEAKKQRVVVVELPAHGDDNTYPALVSIDAYRDKVIGAINGVKGKVILVGHSMGGVVVTAVSEKIPDRIEKLIYVGAFVPANGQSLFELASQDKQSQLGPALIPSKDQLTLDVMHDKIISIFCQDAAEPVQKIVLEKYRVEPAIPFTNKVSLTDANFGKVDKYYIHTLQDHAIGADLQNQMAAAAHITKVYSIDTGHSPFLSRPQELTELFLTIVKN